MPPPTTTARRPKRLLMIRSTNFGTGRSSCANCSRVSVAEKIALTVMCGPHGVTDFRIGLTVPSEPLAQAFIDHEDACELELAHGSGPEELRRCGVLNPLWRREYPQHIRCTVG